MQLWRHRLKPVALIAGGIALLAMVGGLLVNALFPPFMGRLRDHSTLVLAADDSVLRAFATSDGAWRFPAGPSEVDAKFLRYLTTFEDGRFGWHVPGGDSDRQ